MRIYIHSNLYLASQYREDNYGDTPSPNSSTGSSVGGAVGGVIVALLVVGGIAVVVIVVVVKQVRSSPKRGGDLKERDGMAVENASYGGKKAT